ncbi:MAG: DUF2293 domain-containing protein [Pseudomonadota bacterium]
MKSTGRQKEIKRRIRALVPKATMEDFLAIEDLALAGHLRHLPPSISAWQAVTARARHAHTDYDELLADGYDKDSARHFVLDATNEKLAEWGCNERVSDTDPLEQ